MQKKLIILLLGIFFLFWGCKVEQPNAPKLDIQQNQLVLSKMVAVGNSLTAGFQSSGLKQEFQEHSYPYFIAQQMGKADIFQQPLIAEPGIGSPAGKTPQYIDGSGNIVQDDLTVDPATLLLNALLPRPYDNLGIPGVNLDEALNALDATYSENGFVDIVLRNSAFGGISQIKQAILLKPSLLLLWLGNNDVLGAALAGGDLTQITSQQDFQTDMTTILTTLRTDLTRTAIFMANIPYVTDIPFVNTIPPVVINPATGQPVTDDQGNPIPLLTEETNVQYVLLTANELMTAGTGIPVSLGGNGQNLPGAVTLTVSEVTTIKNAVDGFNQIIDGIAQNFVATVVDANSMLTELNENGIDGLNGKYVSVDTEGKTAFSLDGVHPNDAGYALVANEFIEAINTAYGLSIPKLDAASYAGQYVGKPIAAKTLYESVKSVKAIF